MTTSPTQRIREMQLAEESQIAQRRADPEKIVRLARELLEIYRAEDETKRERESSLNENS